MLQRSSLATSCLGAMFFAATMLVGCGSGDAGRKDVAPVSGTVTCNGKPLTSGRISFVPVPKGADMEAGKPASGTIGPDGKYTLTTYGDDDGAVIGKHVVQVTPVEVEDDAPPKRLPCVPHPEITKDVLNESNTIDVELGRAP